MGDFERDALRMEAGVSQHSSNATAGNSSIFADLSASTNPHSSPQDGLSRTVEHINPLRILWSRCCHYVSWKDRNEEPFSGGPVDGSDIDRPKTIKAPSQRAIKVRSLKLNGDGYPHLAAFADSDESFMVYRRFGYLQARILLEKQDELRRLEEQLDDLDENETDPDSLFLRDLQGENRKKLLNDIETKFCEYARVVGAAHQFMGAQRPTRSEYRSVLNFMDCNPVHPKEFEYVYWKQDLFSLRPGREKAWLDKALEKILLYTWNSTVKSVFRSKELAMKSDNPQHVFYDRERIGICASTIITIAILFLLIVPIYLLYHLVEIGNGSLNARSAGLCIGILLIFTLVFSAVMSFFTRAKRHEIFAAAAAYCAVLVVFMGNVGS